MEIELIQDCGFCTIGEVLDAGHDGAYIGSQLLLFDGRATGAGTVDGIVPVFDLYNKTSRFVNLNAPNARPVKITVKAEVIRLGDAAT